MLRAVFYSLVLQNQMLGKSKSVKRSQTLRQFEVFLKKRNQSNFILQSENQSVNAKVKCFEELIKLTRTGATLTLQSSPSEDPHRCKSSKNYIPQNQEPFSEIEENTEFMAGKLNKMAHELKSWDVSKQTSSHQESLKQANQKIKERTEYLSKSRNEKKTKKFHSSSTNASRILKKETHNPQEDKCRWFVEAENRPEHCPIRKKNRAYMSRYLNLKKNHNYNASSPSLNIEIKEENFTNLKKQIVDLESKARECYGISFDTQKEPQEDFVDFSPPENLQYARAIATADGRRRVYQDSYDKLKKEHMQDDSSIPSKFLGFIRSSESKKRPFTQQCCSRRYIRV